MRIQDPACSCLRQVDLLTTYQLHSISVDSIGVQQREYASEFYLSFSSDAESWTDSTFYPGVDGVQQNISYTLFEKPKARYVKIVVYTDSGRASLHWELSGCVFGNTCRCEDLRYFSHRFLVFAACPQLVVNGDHIWSAGESVGFFLEFRCFSCYTSGGEAVYSTQCHDPGSGFPEWTPQFESCSIGIATTTIFNTRLKWA